MSYLENIWLWVLTRVIVKTFR